MTTITQYKCPLCMLQSHTGQFVDRTLLDPSDFGWLITQECRGRRGFPTIEKTAFINKIQEYPQVFDRLKDACLGLINALYKRNLIKLEELQISKELDLRDQSIENIKEKSEKEIDVRDQKIQLLTENNLKLKKYINELKENKDTDEIQQYYEIQQQKSNERIDSITQYYENVIERLNEQSEQLGSENYELKEKLTDLYTQFNG